MCPGGVNHGVRQNAAWIHERARSDEEQARFTPGFMLFHARVHNDAAVCCLTTYRRCLLRQQSFEVGDSEEAFFSEGEDDDEMRKVRMFTLEQVVQGKNISEVRIQLELDMGRPLSEEV